MATISENLQILKNSITSIKQAIINKCGNVEGNITTYADYINNINTNTGDNQSPIPASISDVNFLDYDGTILYSYTKEQFLALSVMPGLPTREGLICQGWNWDFDEAKECVTDYGKLNIGTMYTTDDGDTRLYIRIATEGRMKVPLRWSQTIANGVSIDWGDGSVVQTFTGTGYKSTTHTYVDPGDYVIRLKVADGCTLGLGMDSESYCVMGSTGNNGKVYCNVLQKVEIGKNIASIDKGAFGYCYSLTSISIPQGVTNINSNAFYYCYSLKSISISRSVTSIGDYMFGYCYSLASVSIPQGVTSIGDYAFYYCDSLTSVSIPQGVTSIGNYMFQGCDSLASVSIPQGVTSIGNYAFYNCYSLASVSIPQGVTSIGDYAFCYCYSLKSISIPQGVTNINSNAFYYCSSLASVSIPQGVTSIKSSVFGYCYGMAIYDFTKHTSVPTLSNTSAFSGIPSDCVIKVPESLVEEWKAATNWSTYASKIVAG